MQGVFLILLFILGACFGSFLCCQARRMKVTKKNFPSRSVCLHCKKQLKWYDNIPVISWLLLGGKCRYCKKKIGAAEILAEIIAGLLWLLLGLNINVVTASGMEWGLFVYILILTLPLFFLAIYDGLYGELPTRILILSIILAAVIPIFKIVFPVFASDPPFDTILKTLFSALILGGLYLVLYLVSKGKWVGDGDWLLGLAVGLALSEPFLALVTLFLANFLACVTALPLVRKTKHFKIHFGPFLVVAFVITTAFSSLLMSILML